MPKRNIEVPTRFEDYKVAELRDIAENEFAVDVPENANEAEVLAAFAESGVTFDMHVANHPEVFAKPEPEPEVKEAPENVVTSQAMQEQPVQDEDIKIVVKEEVPLHSKEQWLIKMTRANPLYEVKGVRFTRANPYALVSPDVAEYLLAREEGFRQATPRELEEFYG